MGRRNFNGQRAGLLLILGLVAAYFGVEVYQFGEGVAQHGSVDGYLEARAKTRRLQTAVELINRHYVDGPAVEMDVVTERALESIVSGLDPYSSYLSREAFDNLRETTQQEFGGIGIRVEMKDERLTIVAPMDGTPGARAGLLRGDQITAVDGKSIERMSLRESVSALRGPAGSETVLTVYRPRNGESFDAPIIREVIEVDNVKDVRMLEGRIGYLRILQFGDRTAAEMIQGIERLKSQGMLGLIVDLRNNPGGLLEAAVEVASPFLEEGQLVVYTEGRRREQRQQWNVAKQLASYRFPLALLVNSGSASASEIVAGALKDWERATLVGETTFGKGSVQSVIGLGDDAALSLTTARYFTPGGYVIHGVGVEPDHLVELSVEEDRKLALQYYQGEFMSDEEFAESFDFEPITDRQLEAALAILRREAAAEPAAN